MYARLTLTESFTLFKSYINDQSEKLAFNKLEYIKRIFYYIYRIEIDKKTTNKYFHNDIFDMLYDMDKKDLIQYELDMKELVDLTECVTINNNYDKENTTLEY